jgi:hypothetical protein
MLASLIFLRIKLFTAFVNGLAFIAAPAQYRTKELLDSRSVEHQPLEGEPGRRQAGRLSSSGVDLLDLEYLDAAVGPLPKLDGDVRRHEGAADAHPLLLPVDHVALQIFTHATNTQHQVNTPTQQ